MISIRDCPSDIQISPFKMNLKRQKWLVVAVYTPPSQCKSYFTTELTKVLDKWRGKFESIGVQRDFNMEPTNQEMTSFMADTAFINIIKSDSFFKTSTGTFIDLILTNKSKRFQNTAVTETGASDHHLLIFKSL